MAGMLPNGTLINSTLINSTLINSMLLDSRPLDSRPLDSTFPTGALLWCALFAALGAIGTRVVRGYALRRRLLDQPGERRSHAVATPRGGGLAVVLAVLVAIAALVLRMPREIVLLACAGVGLLLVAGIGWLDDHRPLPPWPKLATHVLAAGWLAAGFFLSGADPRVALAVFLAVPVLVNVWNFMDGIDGLATTQAILVAAAYAWLAGDALTVHVGLAFIASLFGFLPSNFPKAKIFLGDVGSGALGYVLAWLAGAAMTSTAPSAWPLVLLPPAAFLLDAGLTLARRAVRGERWWTPHVGHVYQRWARKAGSHIPVTLSYAAWTMAGCGLMVWLAEGKGRGFAMAAAAWMTAGCAAWGWLDRSRARVVDARERA